MKTNKNILKEFLKNNDEEFFQKNRKFIIEELLLQNNRQTLIKIINTKNLIRSEISQVLKWIEINKSKVNSEIIISLYCNPEFHRHNKISDIFSVVSSRLSLKLIKHLKSFCDEIYCLNIIVQNFSFFSEKELSTAFSWLKLDFVNYDSPNKDMLYKMVGFNISKMYSHSKLTPFLKFLMKNNFDFTEGVEVIQETRSTLYYMNITRVVDPNLYCEIYNSFKKNKNIDKLSCYLFLGMPEEEILKRKKQTYLNYGSFFKFNMNNNDEQIKFIIKKYVLIFNNNNFVFDRKRVFARLMTIFPKKEFQFKLISEVNSNFFNEYEKSSILDMYSSITDNDEYAIKDETKKILEIFFQKFHSKIKLIDLVNINILYSVDSNKNKFYKLVKEQDSILCKLNKKDDPVFGYKNFNHSKFLPVMNTNLIQKISSFSSKEDFKKFFGNKKNMMKTMEKFCEEMDIYKLWIANSLFWADFNYDLIINFINSEIEYPVNEIISFDFVLLLNELKKYYPEKRIVEMLKFELNIGLLENSEKKLENISKYYLGNKDFCMKKNILPKKPKKMNEVLMKIDTENKKTSKEMFSLEQYELMKFDNLIVGNYKFIVPKTNYDLIHAGSVLNQCVGEGNYAQEILNKEIGIILVEENGQLKYCLEILLLKIKIRENRGYRNSTIKKEILDLFKSVINKKST